MSGASTERFTMTTSGLTVRIWNDAAISRRDADGFVNATAMCKANGKRWENYHRCQRTQEYIAALAAVARNRATGSELIHTIQGGTPALQGTWIHPRLAIDLARWISPAFAVWMDGWFLESITQPQQPLQQALPEPQVEGVAVFAQTERHAAQLWREAIQLEITSALAHRLGKSRTEPRLYNCKWLPINPPVSRDEVASVATSPGGFTTQGILEALGKPVTHSNKICVASQLRELGYSKRRYRCGNELPYLWHRTAD